MKKIFVLVMAVAIVASLCVITSADETTVTDGLLGYYALTSDLSNSVEGGTDGEAIGYLFAAAAGDADFTDGSFHTTNGVNDGAKFTADITGDFTVSVTVSMDAYSWAAPIVWIGGTDQSTESWIGLWCDFSDTYGPSVGSNDSSGSRLGVAGGSYAGVTYPVSDLTITLVVESNVAYLYYDGTYVGQSNVSASFDEETGEVASAGAFQTWYASYEITDFSTATMPSPWTDKSDCAIYLGVNAWDAAGTVAYNDLYIYNRALSASEVASIAAAGESGETEPTETAPQTGFGVVALGVVALASGTAVVVSKKRH